jgi:O-antigen/teichoic acid export membrane protein
MGNSRSKQAAKNVSAAMLGQVSNIILNFVCRTIFIYTLGKEYLGVNGLFTNILTIMSLAELGIGEAITYKMYQPVAQGNHEKVKTFMNFYRKAYWLIGTIVFCCGLGLMPFLQYLIKGGEGLKHIRLIYFLYLFNTASTYFFAYKKLIIVTDQKGYIDTYNRYLFLFLQNVVQIGVLLLLKNFIVYLLVKIVMDFLANVNIAHKATKMYPYITEQAQPMQQEEKREIFKQTSAMILHKIGGVCVSGTTNLLISAFIGIVVVGLYSNYTTVIAIPQAFLSYVFVPLTASVGNLVSTTERTHVKKTFDKMWLMNFWLYGFAAICLFMLLNDFIGKVWITEDFLLSVGVVFFAVLNFYLTGMRQTVSSFKTTSGLFWNDRYRPLIEAAVHLGASFVLLKFFGLIGIIIGTTVSLLTTTVWVEGIIVYKNVLGEKRYKFFLTYLGYLVCLGVVGVATYFATAWITVNGIWTFLLKTGICVAVVNLCFLLVFCKTKAFRDLFDSYVRPITRKLFRRK